MSDQNSRPPLPPRPASVHAQRRDPSAPRREASDRVTLRRAQPSGHPSDRDRHHDVVGWTLNVSRGGARLVVEESLGVGQSWDLSVNDDSKSRPIRVVWVREETGGQIVGIQFMDSEGTIPPFEDEP